jgi:hypothetical protein
MPNHLELVTNLAIFRFIVVAGGLYAKDRPYEISPAAAVSARVRLPRLNASVQVPILTTACNRGYK